MHLLDSEIMSEAHDTVCWQGDFFPTRWAGELGGNRSVQAVAEEEDVVVVAGCHAGIHMSLKAVLAETVQAGQGPWLLESVVADIAAEEFAADL